LGIIPVVGIFYAQRKFHSTTREKYKSSKANMKPLSAALEAWSLLFAEMAPEPRRIFQPWGSLNN
jgi:hypothetical protein